MRLGGASESRLAQSPICGSTVSQVLWPVIPLGLWAAVLEPQPYSSNCCFHVSGSTSPMPAKSEVRQIQWTTTTCSHDTVICLYLDEQGAVSERLPSRCCKPKYPMVRI